MQSLKSCSEIYFVLRLKQQAVAERERGNTLFKQAKYDKAIERYTAGYIYLL